MDNQIHSERHIVRKLALREEPGFQEPVGTPADRLNLMWQIAQDCWSFVPGYDAEREFQRHVDHLAVKADCARKKS